LTARKTVPIQYVFRSRIGEEDEVDEVKTKERRQDLGRRWHATSPDARADRPALFRP